MKNMLLAILLFAGFASQQTNSMTPDQCEDDKEASLTEENEDDKEAQVLNNCLTKEDEDDQVSKEASPTEQNSEIVDQRTQILMGAILGLAAFIKLNPKICGAELKSLLVVASFGVSLYKRKKDFHRWKPMIITSWSIIAASIFLKYSKE